MRLIDADALKADYGMADDCKDCKTGYRSCEYDRIYSKMDFCGWLDDAPTVDAVLREIEQANKQAAYVRGYEDGQKDKYGRWGDAIEVVRCRDCKHHHYQNGIPYCDRYYWGWKDDDFCSSGERKDGNDG